MKVHDWVGVGYSDGRYVCMYGGWVCCIHRVSVSVSGHGACSGDRHMSRHIGSSLEKS